MADELAGGMVVIHLDKRIELIPDLGAGKYKAKKLRQGDRKAELRRRGR